MTSIAPFRYHRLFAGISSNIVALIHMKVGLRRVNAGLELGRDVR